MKPVIRKLGLCDYQKIWDEARAFTASRNKGTPDEIWILQHHPVFTQGLAGKPEHLINPGNIPVVQTDRGGQITYHGPGQLIVYPLFNLPRLGCGVKQFVSWLESSVISLLSDYAIKAYSREDAPGVYVDGKKICSLGLKIKHGCSYHGIALNVDMDLTPFNRINPCGYKGLSMTQMKDYLTDINWEELENKITQSICETYALLNKNLGNRHNTNV